MIPCEYFQKELIIAIFIVSCHYGTGTGQNISLVRTEPDPQQLPCPQQRIELQCHTMVPSLGLTWTQTSLHLEFGGVSNIGDMANSSDNTYIAILTNKVVDPNSNIRFFFTSTLLVLEPVNDSTLTCSGGSAADPVTETITITLSGIPDPPSYLSYNNEVVIESSVDLQWTRPSYTGGVDIASYLVSANGETTVVPADEREAVNYNTSSLIYGEVLVSAINTCDQESQHAFISIPAAVPPKLYTSDVVTNCEDVSSPWTISLMYNEHWKKGVVYADVEFSLEFVHINEMVTNIRLTSGDPACSYLIATGIICTVNLPRGVYNISINQTNQLGSTVATDVLDARVFIIEEEILDEKQLSVTVKLTCVCTEPSITAFFGTRPVGGNICNTTEGVFSPGENNTFYVKTDSVVTLGPDEEYCYTISLCGQLDKESDESDHSTGVVNIILSVIFLALVLGLGVSLILIYCKYKQGDKGRSKERTKNVVTPVSQESIKSPAKAHSTYQDPSTIFRSPHPDTGDLYTEVNTQGKTKKMKQNPSTIGDQDVSSGDMPQNTGKKQNNTENKIKEQEKELTDEENTAKLQGMQGESEVLSSTSS